MKSITIAPTMSCNARCYYCFENGSTKGNMSYEVAKQLVKFIDENCIERKLAISWFGGEPLLAVNTIDYITKELTKRGIEISSTITSNGSLVNNEIIKKFKKWNVRRIQITVDCIGEEYNKIKNYQGELNKKAFDLVESNIDLLLKIAGVGILIAVLHQILTKAGRDDQAMMTSLAGMVIVLTIVVKEISTLFDTVRTVFNL